MKEPGYYTTLIGDEAVKLISEQDGQKPFFIYFASLAPHAPFQVSDAISNDTKVQLERPPIMIAALKQIVGSVATRKGAAR